MHTDDIYKLLDSYNMELLRLGKGSLDCSIAEGLFGGAHANNFSSDNVKSGDKQVCYNICINLLSIF